MPGRVKPLKKFGQNYLTDNNIVHKIIDTFNPSIEDSIIEIGPGTGSLTKMIYEKAGPFTVVEIDTRVIEDLKIQYPGLQIINEDFLEVELNSHKPTGKILRIIGNIPYNITSSILFKLIRNRRIISDALLMVQLEVAQRMTSGRGSKDYGILSVLLGYFTETKVCFKISPNVFYPKPKVWSAIVHINFVKGTDDTVDDEDFIQVVKASFGNRRKTLKNSLSNSIFKGVVIDSGQFSLSRRAEELSIQDFITLTKLIKGTGWPKN